MVKKEIKKNMIHNIEIKKEEIIVHVNPKIYDKKIVFSAAYIYIDKAYIFIDGNPDKEFLVTIKPKEKDSDLEKFGRDFNDELLNYAVYFQQSELNKDIKDAIIHKTLLTAGVTQNNTEEEYYEDCNCPSCTAKREEMLNIIPDDEFSSDLDYEDDPLGISKPWNEEKEEEEEDVKCKE